LKAALLPISLKATIDILAKNSASKWQAVYNK
jgi:hypothetical protein